MSKFTFLLRNRFTDEQIIGILKEHEAGTDRLNSHRLLFKFIAHLRSSSPRLLRLRPDGLGLDLRALSRLWNRDSGRREMFSRLRRDRTKEWISARQKFRLFDLIDKLGRLRAIGNQD